MRSSTFKTSLAAFALVCATTLQLPLDTRAQSGMGGAGQGQASGGSVSINNQAGRVQIRLERGSKVSVSNRYGRITVTGWDKDTVEAVAVSSKGVAEAVQLEMTADPQQSRSTVSLAVVGRGRQTNLFYPPAAAISGEQFELLRKTEVMTAEKLKELEKLFERQSEDKSKAKAKSQADREKEKNKNRSETPEGGFVIVQPPAVSVTTPGVIVTAPGDDAAPTVAPPAPPAPARGAQPPTPRPMPAPRPGATVWGPAFGRGGGGDEIHLDVKVPRYAELETISVNAGDLNVSNLDGPVSVESRGGNVTASRLGSLTVRSRGGDVSVDGVEGMVYVVANSGDITIKNAGSEVRATTNNGDINVACARGRVDVSTAYGKIDLNNIGGDVDAVTTNSEVNYTGAITDGGRYRLKSMEGRVRMSIPENSPGFTATLMSYNREAASEFPARTTTPNPSTQAARRREVQHGNGRSTILLDSFGQNVQLTKLAPAGATACR